MESNQMDFPSIEQLEAELEKERGRKRRSRNARNTVLLLLILLIAGALILTILLPVMQISGDAMADTLHDRDVVVALGNGAFSRGDVIAFRFSNSVLVKRVIALSGEIVDVDEAGNVSVNGKPLEEPYVTEKALGSCNIAMPYRVPDGTCFVMGDRRISSVDSRNNAVGCVDEDLVIGRLVFRIWPLDGIGLIR